jgi:hypothetical protein
MRAAGAGVAAGHLTLGAFGWLVLGVPGAMLLFGLCAAVSLGLAMLVAPLLRPPAPPHDDRGPPSGPTEDPPPWWPEFDRAFREWAARERTPA